MSNKSIRAALVLASSLAALALASQARATTDDAAAADNADDQATSAHQTGQANDAQSLTTSDIIVTGSLTAQTAPITASLTTTQPQSAVRRDYIDNANAASDFNELISLTPGVSLSGTGNGQGFGETKAVIRGFQDGEYNVTYDSIPFADTNNPTHHSTAFFPSNTIETIVVDRGPGNASQLGQASFGGNLNLYSRAVKDRAGLQVEGITGNWNTFIGRAEYQTGKMDSLGGAQLVVAGQFLRSDGALTFSPVQSKNLFAKLVLPLGSANKLTVMSTWNRNFYYQSDVLKGASCGSSVKGVTGFSNAALDPAGNVLTHLTGRNCAATSNIGAFGLNYGLGNDPTKPDYYLYNRTDKTTDFSYARLQSQLGGGLSLDNRVYMYGYTNNTLTGNAGTVVTGFSGAGTPLSPYVAINAPASDVLGYYKGNKYRVLGYIGQLTYEFALGKIRAGGWYEHAVTDRRRQDYDRTTGLLSFNEKFNNGNGTAAQNALPGIAFASLSYLQHSTWDQYQLFAEFEFRPVESLSITPGAKYVHFTRGIDAAVNQSSRQPINTQATWTKTLPFLTVNWQPTSNWSFYGQYAQGMYVPDLSSFYSASGSLGTALDALQPQTTSNYQIGTVWHGEKISLDVDAYLIDVNNKIGTCTAVGCDTSLLVNNGQVRYKGVEGQIGLMPTPGLTIFGNASYNYAQSTTTGAQVAKAPFATAAAGMVYSHAGLRVSYSQKYTGTQYATEFNGNPLVRLYRIAPYSTGEFAISQAIAPHFRIGLSVSNVFNNRAITAISNSSSGAPTLTVGTTTYQNGYGQADQFNFLPPRSFQVDVRLSF